MKHYFLEVRSWQPKNKANAIMNEIAQTYNHYLVDESELVKLTIYLSSETDRINELNPRCKDMKFYTRDWMKMDGGRMMAIDDNFQISITEVKRYLITKPIPGPHFKEI